MTAKKYASKTIEEFLPALIGRTFDSIEGAEKDSESVEFRLGADSLTMSHEQDCCEDVHLEQIDGEVADLIGEPLLMAEVVSNKEAPEKYGDTVTWTFVKFATAKGYVTFRWYGSSNGYYGEEPRFRLESADLILSAY